MIINTQVLLYDAKLADLGIDDVQEEWTDFCFDIKEICAVRKYIDPEKAGDNFPCIYLKCGESFVIKMSYLEITNLWKNNQ